MKLGTFMTAIKMQMMTQMIERRLYSLPQSQLQRSEITLVWVGALRQVP